MSIKTYSDELDNLLDQTYLESLVAYKNAAIVGGIGEGADRELVVVGDTYTGFDRYEIFNDQRGLSQEELSKEDYRKLLESKGNEILSENKKIITFDGEIQYDDDCRLGDLVLIVNKKWSIKFTARIIEITKIIEENGLIVTAKFGDAVPTPTNRIRQIVIQNKEFSPFPNKVEGGYF